MKLVLGRVLPLATTGEMIGTGGTHTPTTRASNIPPPIAHLSTCSHCSSPTPRARRSTKMSPDGWDRRHSGPRVEHTICTDDPNHNLTLRGRQHAMHARRSSFFRPARPVCGIGRAWNMVQRPKKISGCNPAVLSRMTHWSVNDPGPFLSHIHGVR